MVVSMTTVYKNITKHFNASNRERNYKNQKIKYHLPT